MSGYGSMPEAGPSSLAGPAISASAQSPNLNSPLRAVKMEDEQDYKQNMHTNGMHAVYEEQKSPAKPERASPQPSRPETVKAEPDVASFLNFETEEDKKVKAESGGTDGGDSRDDSPNLQDDEDEDDKPQRKPGQPVSIAHLPIAEKEVRYCARSSEHKLNDCFAGDG